MKYNVSKVFSTATNTDYDVVFESENLQEAEEMFKKECNQNGSMPRYELGVKEKGEYLSYYVSLQEWDEENEMYEDLKTFDLYEQGPIDRMNYKGKEAVMYWFEARFNVEKGQKVYTFFFHGEEEEGEVLEADLEKWYF